MEGEETMLVRFRKINLTYSIYIRQDQPIVLDLDLEPGEYVVRVEEAYGMGFGPHVLVARHMVDEVRPGSVG